VSIDARVAVLEVAVARLTAQLDAGGPDRLFGSAEAARRLGVKPYTVREWLTDPLHPMHRRARQAFAKLGHSWTTDARRLAALQGSTVRGNGR